MASSPTACAQACRLSALSLISILMAAPLQAELLITEFLAGNDSTLTDEDGDSSDWIELFNSGTGPADLGGYHLTDDAASPRTRTAG